MKPSQFDWTLLTLAFVLMCALMVTIAHVGTVERTAKRLEARLAALEARRPVDLHITVERPQQAAQAVYQVLPHPDWIGR